LLIRNRHVAKGYVTPISCAGPCLRLRITLAITWPQGVIGEDDDLAVAAQVYGDVIRSSMP